MARVGITFDQVAAAADAIVGTGKTASIQAVRESLGTGSPNTIHRHLTAWRSRQAPKQSAAYELPADLANAFGKELARGAAAAKAEVENELVQTQAEAAHLSDIGETLEAERDALADQAVLLTTERDQAQATALERAAEIERQAAAIQREQQAAEFARVELAKAQLKIEAGAERGIELTKEIERLRAALEKAQAGKQAAEQQAAVAAAQLASEQAKSGDLAQRLSAAEKAAQEAQQAADSARRDANTSRIAEQASQARLDAAAREIEQAKESAKSAKAELKKVTDEAAVAAEKSAREIGTLTGKIEALRAPVAAKESK